MAGPDRTKKLLGPGDRTLTLTVHQTELQMLEEHQ